MVTTLGLQRSLKQGAATSKVLADGKCLLNFTNRSQYYSLFFADYNILSGTRQTNKDKLSSRRLEELRAYAGCFYATSM